MITNSDGYVQLIHFLADNLAIFEHHSQQGTSTTDTIGDIFSEHIATNTMAVCNQHQQLTEKHRFVIIREIDAIVGDLEEVLSSIWNISPSHEQMAFIEEFVGLMKNLFDSEISKLV
ncbi:MAG: DUF3802 domain-containing protein [Moritella sp.]|uniref:DUF3802 family protein n=1 Tax=unclassified Moritella TaxID=2637987 RepID=UPI0001568A48|nr:MULTISPECIES: DUF3802 family protein [unclassified Moritella]EDM67155.1 hypothetical protein PE36_22245 [Moritella sp. PE36]MBL1415959.1 DUF3802 family protein [Moritella sp.]PHR88730.1 MAG: DUF3802 domain-containing protein [Moritella sp.]